MTVAHTEAIAADVVALTLVPTHGGHLQAWQPGAHIDLTLPSGLRRQYSLCGSPHDTTSYTIAVRRIANGAASTQIHALTPGTVLDIGGPHNAFPFAHPALSKSSTTSVRLIAGGIGITALRPMIELAHTTGLDWHLTYFGRHHHGMPFIDELAAFGPDRVYIHTSDNLGRPTLETLAATITTDTAVYYCGPAPLIPAITDAAASAGASEIHYERFSPPPLVNATAFTITLTDGTPVHVGSTQSALDALTAVRPSLAYSCRQGFCGTCRLTTRSGTIDRRGTSTFLDDPDSMLPCVDRAPSGANIAINA